MRENSKKILLFLFPTSAEPVWLTFTQLQQLLPSLTKSGLLSTLFLLDKRDFLRIDKTGRDWRYSLSSYGESHLKTLFPALMASLVPSQQKWSMLVFMTAPASDKNFRYLRSYLSQNQAVALTRAVYLLSRNLVEKVSPELDRSYRNAVLLVEVGEWLFGDEYKVIGHKAGLHDLFELYSSISKEVDRLIGIKMDKKTLTQQDNLRFFSALDRFLDLLKQDHALLASYFPDVITVIELLGKFQKLLRI